MEAFDPAGELRHIDIDNLTPPLQSAPIIEAEALLPIPIRMPTQTFQLLERIKVSTQSASEALRLRRDPASRPRDPDRIVYHNGPEEMSSAMREELAQISVPIFFCPHLNGLEPTAELRPKVGERIVKYELREAVGQGSFATVYRANHVETGRPACIKILAHDKDAFEAGLGEIRTHSLIIKHDPECRHALVRMLDFFYYREHLLIVTERLNNSLLQHYMHLNSSSSRTAFYNASTLRTLGAQMLDALAFLHSIGVTHCDVKPPNICIVNSEARQFKLIDLGAAVLTHDVHTSYVQSRWYRAPEVMLGGAWGTNVDSWAFGCVLVELILGCPLYQFPSAELVLAAHKATRGAFPPAMLEHQAASMFFTQSGSAFEVDPPNMPPGTYLIRSSQEASLRSLLTQAIAPCVDFGLEPGSPDFHNMADLLEGLLTLDPSCRLSATAALSHPFVNSDARADADAWSTAPTPLAGDSELVSPGTTMAAQMDLMNAPAKPPPCRRAKVKGAQLEQRLETLSSLSRRPPLSD